MNTRSTGRSLSIAVSGRGACRAFATTAAALGLLVVIGCGGTVPAGLPGSPPSDTLAVTIGARGGEIVGADGSALEGVKLSIPAGALARDTRIEIKRGADDTSLPATSLQCGPLIEIEPAGTALAAVARLTLPFDEIVVATNGSSDRDVKVWVREGDRWGQQRQVDAAQGTVTVELSTLDNAAAGIDPRLLGSTFWQTLMAEAQGTEEITTYHDCNDPTLNNVADALNLICTLFGSGNCATPHISCGHRERELFAGVDLETQPSRGSVWNGMGGAGSIMSDAAICLLEDLVNGPVENQHTLGSPLGNVTVKQTVGLLHFDASTKSVRGYEKLNICLPVLGCFDATAQTFTANHRHFSPASPAGLYAGGFRITDAYGVAVGSDESQKGLDIRPPAIPVRTPYGVVTVQPTFSYQSNADTLFSPFGGTVDNTGLPLLDPNGAVYENLQDLYGRIPGTQLDGTLSLFGLGNSQGWNSAVALGQRSADPVSPVWTSSVAVPDRPDWDLRTARSAREKAPSIAAGAEAEVRYSPTDLLPSALRSSPVDLQFDIYVKPKFHAAASAQFDLSFAEAVMNPRDGGGGRTTPERVEVSTGVGSNSSFVIEAGMVLRAIIHFPWPVGDITLVDIHPDLSIPLGGGGRFTQGAEGHAVSRRLWPDNTHYSEFKRFSNLGQIVDGVSFVQSCLRHPVVDQPNPQPQAAPGNPADLFANIHYPCDVCVGNDAQHIHQQTPSGPVNYDVDQHFETIFPSVEGASWRCDRVTKFGCMDLCSYNGSQLHLYKSAEVLFADGHCQFEPPR